MLALGLLWGAYLVQLASPLRTNTDATQFLDLAASASDGAGFVVDGKPSHFPPGYPLVLAALDRAGLACSASFIGLNLLALAVGLVATAYILHRSLGFGTLALLGIANLTMLCWVLIKHVTLPLSDIPYFGLAQACVALLTWAIDQPRNQRIAGLGLAILVALAAISVRTVGISLLPAIVFASLPIGLVERCGELARRRRAGGVGIALALIGGAVIACPLIVRTQYFANFLAAWFETYGLDDLAGAKLSDWGELVVNTSAAKLPASLRGGVAAAGLLVPILLVLGARQRRRLAPVDVYTASYLAILLVWPYQDARFWIPLFPVFLGYAWLALARFTEYRVVRWAGLTYLTAFSLLGVVALAYSSWISLAHDRFPERFAGGVYGGSYHAAWSPKATPVNQHARVDPQIVRLVQRYSRPIR
jgi:hypothetical protein